MADINYPIPENPQYNTEIRALQNSDPANATDVFNPLFEKIIENIHFVKLGSERDLTALEETIKTEIESEKVARENADAELQSAIEQAFKGDIKMEEDEKGTTITVTDEDGVEKSVYISKSSSFPEINSWEQVHLILKAGLGPIFFPVGYEFSNLADTTDGIVWVVRGHNHHETINGKENNMTLESKYPINKVSFSYNEDLFVAPEAISSGKIIRINSYSNYDGGSYQRYFKTTVDIPKDGTLYPYQSHNIITSTWMDTYDENGSHLEELNGSATSPGLATSDIILQAKSNAIGSTTPSNYVSYLNTADRSIYGSNNYAQSRVRYWMNNQVADESNTPFPELTQFVRGHSRTDESFTANFEQSFLDLVQNTIISCSTNTGFETGTIDGTIFSKCDWNYSLTDKFFLLSEGEIFGDDKDGSQLEYYKNVTEMERIKYEPNGIARSVALRTPYSKSQYISESSQRSGINIETGELQGNYSNYVCPACVIA